MFKCSSEHKNNMNMLFYVLSLLSQMNKAYHDAPTLTQRLNDTLEVV